jgi:hypothetical protein
MKTDHIYLRRSMLNSAAFRSLNGTAMYVLLQFESRLKKAPTEKHNEYRNLNNGHLEFTYKEAQEKYHIGHSRFSNAIQRLIDTGFLEITQLGGGCVGLPTKYFLSDKWRHYGTDSFKPAVRKKFKGHRFPKK